MKTLVRKENVPYNSHESHDSEEDEGFDNISCHHECSEVRKYSHGVDPGEKTCKEVILAGRHKKLDEYFKKEQSVKNELL